MQFLIPTTANLEATPPKIDCMIKPTLCSSIFNFERAKEAMSQKLCSSSGKGEITGDPWRDHPLLDKAIPGE